MTERAPTPASLALDVQGKGISPGLACGPLRRNAPDLPQDVARGAILVAERAAPEDVGRILAAAGSVTIQGAVLSHVSLLSREFGKPCVALGARVARLLPPGGGLLELLDVVGTRDRAVLDDGDVALLDGERGTIRFPGGLGPEARGRARAIFRALVVLGAAPDDPDAVGEAVDAAGGEPGAATSFLLEAAMVYRLVPPGRPARRLLEALRGSVHGPVVRDVLVPGLRARVIGAARERCERAAEAVSAHDDLDALDRAARGLRASLERDAALLDDIGGLPRSLEPLIAPVLAAVAERRAALVERIRGEVEAGCRLPETPLRHRLGGLFQLVRRARAAGLEGEPVVALQARLAREVARERAETGASLVVALDGSRPAERALVGGKAAGLIAVRGVLPEGCRIPRGFVVTSSAYRIHLLGERGERLREALADGHDESTLSRRARAILLSGDLYDEIPLAVDAALRAMAPVRLAVRSSATIEDGAAGSLAGLFDTYLGVSGLEELLRRVRSAWASLWNARALRALSASGLSPLDAGQAVLVQEMVDVRAAGVLFSRDPSGSPGTMLVNATWGLGEAISQGEVAGDLYWVRRATGKTIVCEPGETSSRIELEPDRPGTREAPLPPELAGRPCLDADHLARLAALARILEETTGRAQDVEFGFEPDGTLVVFQVRRVVPWRAE